MTGLWCSAVPGGIRLVLQIAPNASKITVVGVLDDALKLKLQAQPVEGQANEALVKFLAKALGVRRAAVTISHGSTSRRKLVEVVSATLTVDEVVKRLLQ